jgi:cytochrome c oxidase assembly protein subunit 15
MSDADQIVERSRWPHLVAVALVCATFPLIWVGGLVTTYDAGMAVPDWPTTYGYNMFLYPLSTWISGPWDLFIEHGHRLLGSLVGMLTIGLNIAIWRCDSRTWMRWVGVAALTLVISQGVLGGMRVRMASTDLARAHGCIAPIFFALSAAICVMTSRYWFVNKRQDATANITRKAISVGCMFVGLAYLQVILGAHLRHPSLQWSPTQFRTIVVFHLVAAVLLLLQVISVANQSRQFSPSLKRPAYLLALLVFCQVVLGFATWRAKYGWPSFIPIVAESSADQPIEIALHNALAGGIVRSESMSQAITVTGHVALGSLILATSVCYTTRLAREFAQCKSWNKSARSAAQQTSTMSCVVPPIVVGGATS